MFVMIMISSNFIFSLTNFCVIVSFLTKLLILGILFSIAVRAAVVDKFRYVLILDISPLTSFFLGLREVLVAKLVILVISRLISFILALRELLVAQLVISGILSSIFLILALYTSMHHYKHNFNDIIFYCMT